MFDRLITALIKENKPENLFRVNRNWLEADDLEVLDFMREYLIDYNELPNFQVVNTKYPDLNLPVSGGRFLFELKLLRERHVYSSLAQKLPSIIKDLRNDPLKKVTELQEVVADCMSDDSKSTDSPYAKDASQRHAEYLARIQNKGVTYLSMGHPVLDKLFFGWEKGALVTLAARSGLGKTWFLLRMALLTEAMMPDDFGVLLVFSFEMPAESLKERLDCMRFGLDYDRFKHGELTRAESIRYKKGLEELEQKGSKIVIIDEAFTIDDVHSKILLYMPSIVFIDGSYMLEPDAEEDWKKIVKITRNLKGITRKKGIPIFNTTQMKRGTGTKKSKSSFEAQDDFAWGTSFIQDSDLSITAYQTPQMQYDYEIGFQIAKGRNIKPGTQLIWYNNLVTMEFDFEIRSDNNLGNPVNNTTYDEKPPNF